MQYILLKQFLNYNEVCNRFLKLNYVNHNLGCAT